MPSLPDPRPLIAHVIHRLGVGGLENGVVNLVNRLPLARYRHAIVCLTDFDDFRERIERDDVSVHAINKRGGRDLAASWRLYRLFRELRPAVVHTRNLGTLEAQVPAWLARVPVRLHGEHGWDVFDPQGEVRKYQLLRRWHAPLIHAFVPLSKELEAYLACRAGIALHKIRRIYNGVDLARFDATTSARLPDGFKPQGAVVIGTVGRMHGVKDQVNLVQAFIALHRLDAELAEQARLLMVGDGPLRAQCQRLLDEAGLLDKAWFPGTRHDIPELLQAMDLFVLPSQREGISNTILEAMAAGRPVVATDVGGNPELVVHEQTGLLVPPADAMALAQAMAAYLSDRKLLLLHGIEGRARAEREFSLEGMMQRYNRLYDIELERHAPQLRIAD